MAIEARVRTVWELVNHVSGPAKQIAREMNIVRRASERVKSALHSVAGQLLAIGGISAGAAGIYGLVRDMIRFNTEMEQTTLGMGGLLWQLQALSKTQPFKNLNEAIAYGAKVFRDFEEYAKNAAGSAEDYIQTWKSLVTPLATAGASLEQISHVTKMLVPQALSLGYSAQSATMAMVYMIMGMARSENAFVMTLLKMGGYTVKTWNEMARRNPKKAVAELIRLLDLGKDAAKAYGDTMASQLSTVGDNIMQLKRAVGRELWKAVKQLVVQFNEFMTNKEKVASFAKDVSDKLVGAFRTLINILRVLRDHMDAIITVTKLYFGFWLAKKGYLAVTAIVAAISRIAKAWEAVRTAAVAAEAAEEAATLAGGAKAVGMLGKFGKVASAGAGLAAIAAGVVLATGHGISEAEKIKDIGKQLKDLKERLGREKYSELYQKAFHEAVKRGIPYASEQGQKFILAYMRAQLAHQREIQKIQAKAPAIKQPSLDIPVQKLADAVDKLHKKGIKVHITVERDRDYPDRIAVQVFDAMNRRVEHPVEGAGYLVYER